MKYANYIEIENNLKNKELVLRLSIYDTYKVPVFESVEDFKEYYKLNCSRQEFLDLVKEFVESEKYKYPDMDESMLYEKCEKIVYEKLHSKKEVMRKEFAKNAQKTNSFSAIYITAESKHDLELTNYCIYLAINENVANEIIKYSGKTNCTIINIVGYDNIFNK